MIKEVKDLVDKFSDKNQPELKNSSYICDKQLEMAYKSTDYKDDELQIARFAKALSHPARVAILNCPRGLLEYQPESHHAK